MRQLFFALLISWVIGLIVFINHIPQPPEKGAREAQAHRLSPHLVVLTGGRQRLEAGFHLLHTLPDASLFITGVGTDVRLEEVIESYVPAADRQPLTYYQERVSLGYVARSTVGNVREVNAWRMANPAPRVTLITSNYHMPRSTLLFNAAFPDLEIVPHSVFESAYTDGEWWQDEHVFGLVLSEYHKWLVSYLQFELLGAPLT